MTISTQTIGARILNALHDRLQSPDEASQLVRSVIRTVGEDNANLPHAVLDKLHMELPYPTEACAVVRAATGIDLAPTALAA